MFIYIDTENVESDWVDILSKLTRDDTVYVFYTKNSKGIDVGKLDMIRKTDVDIEFFESSTGENALDFVLSSFLGSRIKKSNKHVILSADAGYSPLVKFWHDYAEVIVVADKKSLLEYIETGEIPMPKTISSGKLVNCIKVSEPQKRQVQSILDKVGSEDLNEIYQALTKNFGQDDGASIYRQVRFQLKK